MSETLNKCGYSHYVFPICILYSILMILGGYFSIVYIFTCFITLIVFINTDIDKGLSALFFLLPFSQVFKLNPNSTSLHTYLVLIFVIINIFRLKHFKRKVLVPYFLLSVYMLLGIGSEITTYIKLLAGGLMLYECVELLDNEKCPNLMFSYSIGFIVSSFLGIDKHLNQRYIPFFSEFNEDFIAGHVVFRFSGLYEDCNYFSVNAFFIVAYFLLLVFNGKQSKLLSITIIVASIVFGCLTYSKMFILSMILLLFLFVKEQLKNPKHIIITFFGFLVVTFTGYTFALSSGFFNGIMSRFNAKDISNNRVNIWRNYLNYIFSSIKTMIFGDGLGAPYYGGVGPHNTYIELVYFLGILGGSLLVSYIIIVIRSNINGVKPKLINYVSLYIFLFMIFTLGVLKTSDLFFDCILIWIMLNMDSYIKIKGFSKKINKGVLIE